MAQRSGFHRANKNPPGEWLVYNLLLVPGLKRAFGGVYARIDTATLKLRSKGTHPVIFCLTHSGWFDGHIAALLNKRVFEHDAYLMMEEPNLSRYPFFTWAGVFGVDREDPRKALNSIKYITALLTDGENKALWMFPQGTMRHPDARPLKLFGGVANIARRVGECWIVPVAIRYDFMIEQAPDAYVRIGPPILFDQESEAAGSRALTEKLREAIATEAGALHADVAAYHKSSYKHVLGGRGSVNRLWDGVMSGIGKIRRLFGGTQN